MPDDVVLCCVVLLCGVVVDIDIGEWMVAAFLVLLRFVLSERA